MACQTEARVNTKFLYGLGLEVQLGCCFVLLPLVGTPTMALFVTHDSCRCSLPPCGLNTWPDGADGKCVDPSSAVDLSQRPYQLHVHVSQTLNFQRARVAGTGRLCVRVSGSVED